MARAVVLLSGGLDSATCLAIARSKGEEVATLAFDYGQRHRIELELAQQQARFNGVIDHTTAKIDLRAFGGSALTDDIAVPKHEDAAEIGTGIPVTYVPARNTIFLSFGLGKAEVFGAEAVYIGVNALDYSGYPDCRPEFIAAFQNLATIATKAGVEGRPLRIEAPLQDLTKSEIIRLGLDLGVDYGATTSCYDPAPNGAPCGHCDSCLLRAKGFAEVGVPDPRVEMFRS